MGSIFLRDEKTYSLIRYYIAKDMKMLKKNKNKT